MNTPSLSRNIVAQIRCGRGFGVPWEIISSKLGIPVDDCRAAIGLPSLKPIPNEASEPDLFSGLERLEKQL